MLNTKRLTLAECAVVISIAILSKAGTPTTPKEIADYLKEDVQTVRNILERLRNKGLVLSSLAFGLGGFASISSSSQVRGRERIYRLVDDVKNILDKYPEILKWTKVNLGIEDEKKLMEFINKRAEELRLVLSASSARGVPYDQMPLHTAAFRGRVEDVKLLLERGADPNAKDNAGRTPLHFAAFRGHVEIVKLLLERGADPWIADNDGRIPLDYAYDSTIRSLLIRSLLESVMRKNELRDSEGLQSG